VPPWWEELTVFVAARHYPGRAAQVLRALGAVLTADPSRTSPQQLVQRLANGNDAPDALSRALTAFFTEAGLALPTDESRRRADKRRQGYLDAVPVSFQLAVVAFNQNLLSERDRARRIGAQPISDVTVENKLRILRDLAKHLSEVRRVTGWVEVTTADLDSMLSLTPQARHQQTYVLRQFFAWVKGQRLLLIDPAKALRLGPQPGFVGALLQPARQRALLRRWTRDDVHPYERIIGLLARLHAASNQRSARSTSTTSTPQIARSPSAGARSPARSTRPRGQRSRPACSTAASCRPSTRTCWSPRRRAPAAAQPTAPTSPKCWPRPGRRHRPADRPESPSSSPTSTPSSPPPRSACRTQGSCATSPTTSTTIRLTKTTRK